MNKFPFIFLAAAWCLLHFMCCPASTGWDSIYPGAVGNIHHAAWGSSADNVYLAGDDGIVLHWNGSTWSRIDSPTTDNLRCVWGSGPDDVFAASTYGVIIHWDGGAWRVMESGAAESLSGLWGSGAADVFAVGGSGLILHYDGVEWSAMDSGTDCSLSGVWGAAADDVFAVGANGTILHWNGVSWSTFPNQTDLGLRCVWGVTGEDVFAAGDGIVLHWDGQRWAFIYVDYGDFSGIWSASAQDVYTVESFSMHGGRWGELWHWDGVGWTELLAETHVDPLIGVWGLAADNIYAVGEQTIMHWNGIAWTDLAHPAGELLNDLWGTGPDDLFLVGGGIRTTYDFAGGIAHFDGEHWLKMDTGAETIAFSSIWGSSTDDVFALGVNAGGETRIFHWNGTNWSTMDSGGVTNVQSLWGSSATNVLAVGSNDGVSQFAGYDGNVWRLVPTGGLGNGLTELWGSSADDVFLVGYGGVILHWDGAALTVMDSGVTDDLYAIRGTARDDVYALGEDYDGATFILHWNGNIWQRMTTPESAAISGLWAAAAGDVYTVCEWYFYPITGPVLHWDGIAWSVIFFEPDVSLNKVWGLSSSDIYAFGYHAVFHFDGSYPRGVRLSVPPATHPGQEFEVRGYLDNTDSTLDDILVFFVLEADGQYWFWDDWTYVDANGAGEYDYMTMTIPVGATPIEVVPRFVWPDTGAVSVSGLRFYGAMIDPENASVIGGLAMAEFSFGPATDGQ